MYRARGLDRNAYQYNAQPVEDLEEVREEVDHGKRQPPPSRTGNYKPTPLRWPFILCQIILLCCAIGLIVYAYLAMPNSDSTAQLQARSFPVLRSDWNASSTTNSPAATSPVDSSSDGITSPGSTVIASTSAASSTPPTAGTTTTRPEPDTAQDTSIIGSSTTDGVSTARTQAPAEGSTTASSAASATGLRSSSPVPGSTTAAPETQTTTRSTISSSPSSEERPSRTRPGAQTTPSSSTTSTSQTQDTSESSPSATPQTLTHTTPSGTSSQTGSITATSTESGRTTSSSTSTESSTSTAASTRGKGQASTQSTSTPTSSSTTSGVTRHGPNSELTGVTTYTTSTARTITVSATTRTLTSTGTTTFNSTMTVTRTSVSSGSTFTTTWTSGGIVTMTSATTETSVHQTGTVTTTRFSPFRTSTSATVTETDTEPDSTILETSTLVTQVTSTFTNTLTETQSQSQYIVYGPVTITSSYTIDVPPQTQPAQAPKSQPPVTQVITSVADGATVTYVQTGAPQTLVVNTGQTVETEAFTPPPQTIVTHVGGTPTTMVIVVTPSPQSQAGAVVAVQVLSTVGGTPVTMVQQNLQTYVTNVGGSLETVVRTPPPTTYETIVNGVLQTAVSQPPPETIVTQVGGTLETLVQTLPPSTYVTNMGGTLVTVEAMSAVPGGYQPISWTVVSTIGGTLTTMVSTPAPYSYTAMVDGTLTTLWTTPPPQTYTTIVGGTPTTMVVQTTPTASNPISYTITTTIGDTLSTYVSTGTPSTMVTTISGHLTTIVSTPTPRTFTSTLPKSTILSTTVSTPTPSPDPSNKNGSNSSTVVTTKKVLDLEPAAYFVATFLPTFVAVMLTIPLRVIDLNAKLYQPFHALTRPGGAGGAESLNLQYTGIQGFVTPIFSLAHGQPVPFVTTLMVWASSLVAPLATEAFGLKIHGSCSVTDAQGCAGALGVSVAPALALAALLAVIVILLGTLLILLQKWETGVYANPWTVAGIASLSGCPDVRIQQTDERSMKAAVARRQYRLGYYENHNGEEEYGIILNDDSSWSLRGGERNAGDAAVEDEDSPYDEEEYSRAGGAPRAEGGKRRRIIRSVPFLALTIAWRVLFMLFLGGLLAFVAYYSLALDPRSPFALFVARNSFGVRFALAALGVAATFCWSALFFAVAAAAPYAAMARGTSQPAEASVLLAGRPTNEFWGAWAAARQRQWFPLAAALATALAEFLPVLLANVPYSVAQTQASSVACSRASVAALALMLLVLLASFPSLARWPRLPADPRSVAGAMFYVSDSYMLPDFSSGSRGAGLSRLDGRARDARVCKMGRRYYYGDITGRSGRRRKGVDTDVGTDFENADTAYRGAGAF